MTTAAPTIFADDQSTARAVLFGADFSALSITPARGDLAPGVARTALARFAPWDATHLRDLAGTVTDLGDSGAIRERWDGACVAIEYRAAQAWKLSAQLGAATHSGDASGSPAFVMALGGDHSVTWPLVRACATAHPGARIGIVQLDVHHDVRPIVGGPSNGTPIRGLIEQGIVAGSDVAQIGIHPFGNRREHTEFCDEVGIRRWSLADVRSLGVDRCVEGALDALDTCDVIYLTVDIDVLDRCHAPGTVAALPGGLASHELARLVSLVCAHPRTRAMDIVEFDPERDVGSITAWNVANVLLSGLSAALGRRA